MDPSQIANVFVKQYYDTFDKNRPEVVGLYHPQTCVLTFEGQVCSGKEEIMKKLTSLAFTNIQHVITTVDAQPTYDDMIVVFVVGQLKTDEDNPHSFSQTFVLKKEADNRLYVVNDMFRLSLHHG